MKSGVTSTVVFGHVPDVNPTSHPDEGQGHPKYLKDALPLFEYDVQEMKGQYYFAGHDHGLYGPTSYGLGKGLKLMQVVSAAGGNSRSKLGYFLETVTNGKVTDVAKVVVPASQV